MSLTNSPTEETQNGCHAGKTRWRGSAMSSHIKPWMWVTAYMMTFWCVVMNLSCFRHGSLDPTIAQVLWIPQSYTEADDDATMTVPSSSRPPPSGTTLNGYEIHLVEEPPQTKVHCVGDTYQASSSWMFRSCQYELLCFDLNLKDFVVYDPTNQAVVMEESSSSANASETLPPGWYSSILRQDSQEAGLAVNARPPSTPLYELPSSKLPEEVWFRPIVEKATIPQSYYLLDVTMIPFLRHRIGYRNPGHHIWQDLVSLYTLIDMFDKEETDIYLVPLQRQKVGPKEYREGDADLMNRWGSKMMGHANFDQYNPFWEDGDMVFRVNGQRITSIDSLPTRNICTTSSLVGVGNYGHHELHQHNGTHRGNKKVEGDVPIDRDMVPYLHGKGGFFRRMRSFLLRKVGARDFSKERRDRRRSQHEGGASSSPYEILFSLQSSTRGRRKEADLTGYVQYLRREFSTSVNIQAMVLSTLTTTEEIELMTRTDVFVTVTGGGTASALFLPPGAHMILFYDRWFLDWDYWNNIPHIHVHWIPIEDASDPSRLLDMKKLVIACLDL